MTRSAGVAVVAPFGPPAANDQVPRPEQAPARPRLATVEEASERTMSEQQTVAEVSAVIEPNAGDVSENRPAARPAEPERRPPHNGPNLTPRMIAKAEIFVEGDHVVYPTHGVGRVERIVIEEIAGHRLELIHITFEENRMTLRVPVPKARSAGLRKLSTDDEFQKALDVLRGKARVKRTMWSRRAQEYDAKINSGDPVAIAEVVRDLHRNAGQPDQSFSERQIYESALDRLAAELAALDSTDKPTAIAKLIEFMKVA